MTLFIFNKFVHFYCRTSDSNEVFFSTRGCHVVAVYTNSVTCKCNHLTNFVILFTNQVTNITSFSSSSSSSSSSFSSSFASLHFSFSSSSSCFSSCLGRQFFPFLLLLILCSLSFSSYLYNIFMFIYQINN